MKKTSKCPKCGSNRILFVPGKVDSYGTGNNIRVGWTNMKSVLVNRYVCCDCGFSEEWIDIDDIEKLKKKFEQ